VKSGTLLVVTVFFVVASIVAALGASAGANGATKGVPPPRFVLLTTSGAGYYRMTQVVKT